MSAKDIRNIVLLGHSGSGKTTLAESMLYLTGGTDRLGRIADGNITPALLKRKFGTDARAVYPKLSTRLALSERGGGRPYALLMREGLMPYAEVVLGSKRLCASAKRCTVLAFLAATASTLLAFYLTFVGAYSVLTPFSLLIYVLLWSLSALVDALLSDRY